MTDYKHEDNSLCRTCFGKEIGHSGQTLIKNQQYMKKFLIWAGLIIIIGIAGFMTFVYFITFSEGYRAGELIKFSQKGVMFKTWEGEISKGISNEKPFLFSVLDSNDDVIDQLTNLQGKRVRLTYKERYRTFVWWGDTRYFITKAEKIKGTEDTNLEKENKKLKERIEELEKELYELKYKSD